MTNIDDEREALAEVRHNATHFDSKMTEEGFDRAIGVIRHRGPITDEVRDAARKAAYGAWIATDLGADGPSLYAIVDAALEAAEAAR